MWQVDASELADNLVPIVTIWREAANQGVAGMTAVGYVIQNRAIKRNLTPTQVCLQPLQFSSMTAPNDPGLTHWPMPDDPVFQQCYEAWQNILNGVSTDPTAGATLYYAVYIDPPYWVSSPNVTFTVQIGTQRFYKES
jgi:Cell Wall Hydrolase